MKSATLSSPTVISAPDGTIGNEQLRQLVKEGKGEKTLTAYAKQLKVSFQFLGKVINGEYQPGPRIAKSLGYEQIVTYRFRKIKPRKAVQAKAKGKK